MTDGEHNDWVPTVWEWQWRLYSMVVSRNGEGFAWTVQRADGPPFRASGQRELLVDAQADAENAAGADVARRSQKVEGT